MKKILISLSCALLVSSAKAAPKPRTDLQQRLLVGGYTNIRIGGATISTPPQILRVEAQTFFYKPGGAGSATPYGRTVLVGQARLPIRGDHGDLPTYISGPEIEVETALTEIELQAGGTEQATPWDVLADALRAAPHSPRFCLYWGEKKGGRYLSMNLLYDRRTRNIFRTSTYQFQKPNGSQARKVGSKSEPIISDAEIERRAAPVREQRALLNTAPAVEHSPAQK